MNTSTHGRHVELAVTGMTCASCASRVETRLNDLAGVRASVNFATETATVDFDPAHVSPEALVGAVESAGYHAQVADARVAAHDHGSGSDDELAALGRRLLVTTLLAAPVLAMAMIPALQFTNWQWLSLTLAAPVAVWGAWPFHAAAWQNLRHGAATMDTLISLGVLAAFGWSVWALFWGDAGMPGMTMTFSLIGSSGDASSHLYLEVASVVTVFLLAGRYLEARAKRRSGAALRALLELGAKEATVLDSDGRERLVPVEALQVGDRFVVRPGDKIAADGVVVDGASAVDASLLTGESTPVEVGTGDAVTGGTVNVGGRLVVQATRVGADTALAQMGRLVRDAQAGKAPVQRLADRIAGVFVPVVILLAVVTLIAWIVATGDVERAFTAAVAVLIIACPCALGLATPTALLVGTGRAAQLGIVIKGPEILESTRRVDTVVLDKTGTVTTGHMAVVDVVTVEGVTVADAFRLVGAVEHASEHPVGKAIADEARRRLGTLATVESFANRPGLGVEGVVDGRAIVAGRASLLTDWSLALPGSLATAAAGAEAAGRTVVAAASDGEVIAVFVVADALKPSSAAAVARLRRLGLRPVLLTGDNVATAQSVAAEVGIDDVIAGVLPAGKVEAVASRQRSGRVVAMVGDGVNDAGALAQADLGIAIGTGSDVAIEASDLTIVGGDLRAAGDAIELSRRTLRTIKGNLFWAFAYNVAALPLAATGLLNPLIAGLAMAASSVFVVTNSLRLRRFSPSA